MQQNNSVTNGPHSPNSFNYSAADRHFHIFPLSLQETKAFFLFSDCRLAPRLLAFTLCRKKATRSPTAYVVRKRNPGSLSQLYKICEKHIPSNTLKKRMARYDYVKSRDEVIRNIQTLYNYLEEPNGSKHRTWALNRIKMGAGFIVELIGKQLCFCPSRFACFRNNTQEKHEPDYGANGNTGTVLQAYYDKVRDERIDRAFQEHIAPFGLTTPRKFFWIPKGQTIEELLEHAQTSGRQYWIAHLDDEEHWGKALQENIWLTQQRYGLQDAHAVTATLATISHIKTGDVLLLAFGNELCAYGTAKACPFTSEQVSSISATIERKEHDYFSGRVRFSDHEVFYEELETGCNNWGQRIAVDNWHCYLRPSAVSTADIQRLTTADTGNVTIFGISPQQGAKKMKELRKQYEAQNTLIADTCRIARQKLNIILQGAPGTGKTYHTAAIALSLLGVDDIDLKDHAAVMLRYASLQDKQIFFTTFHQSMDYEDFVEGMKPHVHTDAAGQNLGVSYEVENGIFKRTCNATKSGLPAVLIIDEINRGNVSKIFGELITLLEPDKRKEGRHPLGIILPYSKETFYVPSELYIIGTMNTTDRSTGALDYALRRRFAFITLKSDRHAVEQFYDGIGLPDLKNTALALFHDIRAFIANPQHLYGEMDTDDLMVGHSYFMANSEEELRDKMIYEVIPLVQEYINDGILHVSPSEKMEAFQAWAQLETISGKEFAEV